VKKTLARAVDFYLETRRQFGFALVQTGVELRSFLRYAKESGHTGFLTTALATQWAQEPQECQPSYRACRLGIVRRFAQFWLPYDSRTEIPPLDSFGPVSRRRAVHIYSPDETGALLQASAQLGRVHPLRAASFRTVVTLRRVVGIPSVFSRREPEKSDSAQRVRQCQ